MQSGDEQQARNQGLVADASVTIKHSGSCRIPEPIEKELGKVTINTLQ